MSEYNDNGHDSAGHLRSELGTFLTTKRKMLQPADFGLPVSAKRRTPGLRREEVAELAQVGFTWYTWLEQGRKIRPSERVLQSIASVLQLNPIEERYVHDLAGHRETVISPDLRAADRPLQEVLDGISFPACVRNARYDVLAWNDPFARFFDFDHGDSELQRNLLWRLFANRWKSIELQNWQELAKALSADFRMTYGRYDAPSFRALVSELRAASPLFAKWWDEFLVGDLREIPVQIVHIIRGKQALVLRHFKVADPEGLMLILMAPVAPQSSTARS